MGAACWIYRVYRHRRWKVDFLFKPVLCLMCYAVNRSGRLRGSKCRSRSKSKSRFDAVLPALLRIPSAKYVSFVVLRVERRRTNSMSACLPLVDETPVFFFLCHGLGMQRTACRTQHSPEGGVFDPPSEACVPCPLGFDAFRTATTFRAQS